jgi:hypothetical protein
MSNPNIDTDSLLVIVSENNGNNVTEFVKARNLYGLNPSSNVYFLDTDIDGSYRVMFGDNILGRKPQNGSVITAEYRAAAGSPANGVDTFAIEVDLATINQTAILGNQTVTTVSVAAGGANAESVESIRYNAPRHYQTQERAVTVNDYRDLIVEEFPDIESVSAYGGESVSGIGAVEYGKVFVSASTFSGTTLSDNQKQEVINYLSPRVPLGITPVIIDPDYTFITMLMNVHVDFTQTSLTPTQIISLVRTTVSTFNDDNLKRFDRDFRLSNLMTAINDSDRAIISNEVSLYLYKKANPPLAISVGINLDYQAPIRPGTVLSSQFTVSGQTYTYTDSISGVTNSAGLLYRLQTSPTSTALNYIIAGKINYDAGTITISPTIYDTVSNSLRIFAIPVNQDIYSQKNEILEIDVGSGISVTVVSG